MTAVPFPQRTQPIEESAPIGQAVVDPSSFVDVDTLVELLTVTWATFVDPECYLAPVDGLIERRPAVVAEIAIAGDAPVRITLSVEQAGAVLVTEMMLGEGAYGAPTQLDVSDAIGELSNVLGGNIKALLPDGSTLTLPNVTAGSTGTAGDNDGTAVTATVAWGPYLVMAGISAEVAGQLPLTASGAAR